MNTQNNINKYIDLLAEIEIHSDTTNAPYYKSNAYKNAANTVFTLDLAHDIDQLLSFGVIKKLRLNVSDEFSEYSVHGSMVYIVQGNEQTHNFYYYEKKFTVHFA